MKSYSILFMKKINLETMRYRIPKVKNRFFSVHSKLIITCFVMSISLILLSISYLVISQSIIFQPKTVMLFFCEVDDFENTTKKMSIYDEMFDICFARYDDLLQEDGNYNLSSFGAEINESFSTFNPAVLVIKIPNSGYGYKVYSYENFGYENDIVLSYLEIESIIIEIR